MLLKVWLFDSSISSTGHLVKPISQSLCRLAKGENGVGESRVFGKLLCWSSQPTFPRYSPLPPVHSALHTSNLHVTSARPLMYYGPVLAHILPESSYSFSVGWVVLCAPPGPICFLTLYHWHPSCPPVLAFWVGATCVAVWPAISKVCSSYHHHMTTECCLSLHTHISRTNLCYSIMWQEIS